MLTLLWPRTARGRLPPGRLASSTLQEAVGPPSPARPGHLWSPPYGCPPLPAGGQGHESSSGGVSWVGGLVQGHGGGAEQEEADPRHRCLPALEEVAAPLPACCTYIPSPPPSPHPSSPPPPPDFTEICSHTSQPVHSNHGCADLVLSQSRGAMASVVASRRSKHSAWDNLP